MAQKRVKKKTPTKKPKERELKVSYIPELCHREYSDAVIVNYKDSGMFAISFITINPHKPDEGTATSVVFMEESDVQKLVEKLNGALGAFQKEHKKK